MLILLSPAKSLDLDSPWPARPTTTPRLLDESQQLIDILRGKSVADLAALMRISDDLAALNAERYLAFDTPFTTANARPALYTFAGDAYQGLDAASFGARDVTEASKTLRMLSGLYGVLRPLDLIQPYRLEMGTRLATPRGDTLYRWWGDRITTLLASDLADSPGARVVINLASQEYSDAVDPDALGARWISPRFEDTNAQGKRSVVSFYAKRARGAMAAWLIRTRARTASALTGFDADGYRFDAAASTPDLPVFVRSFADRP